MTIALASVLLEVYKSFEISSCTTCNTWCRFERTATPNRTTGPYRHSASPAPR